MHQDRIHGEGRKADVRLERPLQLGWCLLQEPPGNWGKKEQEVWKDAGYNLSKYKFLRFWARAENPATVEFKVGGIVGPHGDSAKSGIGKTVDLSPKWTEYTINLSGADLQHIIGGFEWSANKDNNTHGAIFYLDDIRYESR